MKITPEAVKERIAALESAGELSLKEQFYLEALRQLVAAMDSEPVAFINGAWTGIPDIDNAINMLDRIDTLESYDDDRIEAVKTVLRRLAGNSPVVPDGMERVATTLEHIGNFADAAIIRQMAANQQQNAPQNIPEIISEICTWTFSDYDSHWSGTCGAEWVFNDGGPEENGVKFCPKCGKSVAVSATEGTEE